MRRKIIRAIAWAVLIVTALGVITDAMLLFGLTRGIQYAYNAAFFLLVLPCFVFVIYKTDEK